jgi:hypothetical protein
VSDTLTITPGVHKVATIVIEVKHIGPGNVTQYLPVEFEVFGEIGHYKAVPVLCLESRRLTGLLGPIEFEMENGKIHCCQPVEEEVVSALVDKMIKLGIDEEYLQQLDKALHS